MVSGRAAALCQPESGALQPDVGSACGDIIIEKASSEDRRGHSPRTPRGETPQGGKHHTGKPTRQHPPHCESLQEEGCGARLQRWLKILGLLRETKGTPHC